MDNKELLNLRPTLIVRLITKIDNYINYTEKRPSSSRQSMNEEINGRMSALQEQTNFYLLLRTWITHFAG